MKKINMLYIKQLEQYTYNVYLKQVKDREENSINEAHILEYINDVDPDDAVGLLESFYTKMKFYSNEEEECHVIILEYVKGGDLLDRLNKEIIRYPDISKAEFVPNLAFKVDIIRQLLVMTCFLHSHKICHMDITLENIVLRDGHAILLDYGLAEIMNDWMCDKTVCKPYYTSPEICRNESYDGRKRDSWCIGVCFYALISHRYLIYDPNHCKSILKLLDNGFNNYTNVCRIETSYWPKDIVDFLSLCLKSDPNERPLPEDLLCHKIFSKSYENTKENISEMNNKNIKTLEKRTKSNNTIKSLFDFLI